MLFSENIFFDFITKKEIEQQIASPILYNSHGNIKFTNSPKK